MKKVIYIELLKQKALLETVKEQLIVKQKKVKILFKKITVFL